MVRRDAYEQEGSHPSGPGGAFNVFRLLGQSRHLSSGFTGFAIKTFSVSACSSVVFGLSSYMLLGKDLGPVLPFMGGCAFGWVGGLVHRYRCDLAEAKMMACKYPRLMEYHVGMVEPCTIRGTTLEEWMADLKTSVRKQGVLMVALYSAGDTIVKLQEEEEERILEQNYRGGTGDAE